MSIQKKSLINTLKTTKKANVAASPAVEGGKKEVSLRKGELLRPTMGGSLKQPAGIRAKGASAGLKAPAPGISAKAGLNTKAPAGLKYKYVGLKSAPK